MINILISMMKKLIHPPSKRFVQSKWIAHEQENVLGTHRYWLLDVYAVPEGLHNEEDWRIADEIERRWKAGEHMHTPSHTFPNGVEWPASEHPEHPSNNSSHPYYIKRPLKTK